MESTSEMVCVKCSTSITAGEEFVICQGFCTDVYHAACVKLSTDEVTSFKRNHCIWWLCEECGKFLYKIRKDKSLYAARLMQKPKTVVANTKPISPTVSNMDLQEEIQKLKVQMNAVHQSIVDLTTANTLATDTSHDHTPLAQSSPKQFSTLMHGSKCVIPSTDLSASRNKFWMFFTRIKRSVNEQQIMKLVNDSIGTCDVVVKKLVSRWRDVSTMPFISYKVGIDVGLKDLAMNPSSWPKGISFREFQDDYEIWEP